jgi:hypothetical protein
MRPAILLRKITSKYILNIFPRLTGLALFLILGIASTILPVCAQNFADDFTSYPLGVFPYAGGWQLLYNGAGNSSQVVVAAPGPSDRALQLVGSSCWSGDAFNPISLPNLFTLEADLNISGDLSGGCDTDDATFGVENPSIGSYGTGFGTVAFESDGNLHAWGATSDVILMPYKESTWIHVACDYDLTNRLMGVRINGGNTLAQVSIPAAGAPTGIGLGAQHGGSPTLLTANLSLTAFVLPMFTNNPVSQAVDSGQSVTFTAGATAYPAPAYQWLFNGSPIGGATTNIYIINNVQPTNAGSYSLVASNAVGAVKSSVAVLTVQEFPRTATATAIVVNGFVVGTTMIDAGFGYTNTPGARIIGGGGSGAEAVAVVSNGLVTAVSILNPGSGYTNVPIVVIEPPFIHNPVLSIVPMSFLSFSNLTLGGVYQLQQSEGYYWSNQPVSFTATNALDTQIVAGLASSGDYELALSPVPAQAFATPQVVNGFVVGITVTSGGSGYVTNPAVTIVGSGSNATAVASISGGVVTNVAVTDPGAGYTNAPTVEIARPTTAAVSPTILPMVQLNSASLAPYDNYQIQFTPALGATWKNWNGGLFIPTSVTNSQLFFFTNGTGFFRLQYLP